MLLVKCCPQLGLLDLPLDARQVPADIPRSVGIPALTFIQFSDSPIDDPQLMTEVLARHIPSFRGVSCVFKSLRGDDGEILRYRAAWDRVKTCLEELRSQRTVPVTGKSAFFQCPSASLTRAERFVMLSPSNLTKILIGPLSAYHRPLGGDDSAQTNMLYILVFRLRR